MSNSDHAANTPEKYDGVHDDSPQTNTAPEFVPVEWQYSGKALRGRFILILLACIVLIGIGIFLTLQGKIANYLFYGWMTLAVIMFLLWAHYFCVLWYRTMTIKYRLTDHRLELIEGLFTKTTDPMELLYISDLKLEQTLWDRLINGGVGKITIFSTVDKTDSVAVLAGIDNPRDVYEMIDKARCAVRAKRGFIST